MPNCRHQVQRQHWTGKIRRAAGCVQLTLIQKRTVTLQAGRTPRSRRWRTFFPCQRKAQPGTLSTRTASCTTWSPCGARCTLTRWASPRRRTPGSKGARALSCCETSWAQMQRNTHGVDQSEQASAYIHWTRLDLEYTPVTQIGRSSPHTCSRPNGPVPRVQAQHGSATAFFQEVALFAQVCMAHRLLQTLRGECIVDAPCCDRNCLRHSMTSMPALIAFLASDITEFRRTIWVGCSPACGVGCTRNASTASGAQQYRCSTRT